MAKRPVRTGKRTAHPKSLANLKPWKPGQSGNPGGRPKQDEAALLARAIFEHNPEAIYKAMLKALKKGSATVFTALADRGYGKAPQHLSFSGKDGGAIPVTVEGIDEALRKLMSVAEVRKTTEASPDVLMRQRNSEQLDRSRIEEGV